MISFKIRNVMPHVIRYNLYGRRKRMRGQIVFITGSSSGIGRETAYRFSQEGARLVLSFNKGKNRGEAAEKRCRRLGAKDTLLIHLNVMDDTSIRDALRRVRKKFGGIDFLINNAGVGVFQPFKDQTLRNIEQQIRTNLEGLIKVCRIFLPFIRKGIINVASAAGKTAYADMSAYCGTKFGVRGFTQAFAEESPLLRIFCVNPDMTATRLTGYEGRPPSEVAEVIFRAVSGKIKVAQGGDVDVWRVKK
jgi:NAD(P)-dependent dehydrogenase (short-subunit alcohol dehydrogenase family)